jgi:phosphatidylserine decarboxylase
MTLRTVLRRVLMQEDLNFLLTNRLPRRWLTQWVGRWSKVENPLACAAGLGLWRIFGDLDLSDAQRTQFRSVHDCFTRELRAGSRPIAADRRIVVSPCDAIVGASGRVENGLALQAKGFFYPLGDLLPDPDLVARYLDGSYVTLRLTAGMYHRFHAPCDLRLRRVTYISGDTWNVNPIALKRVERLFCKNERAVLECELPDGALLTLVPVAAILVASIRLHALDVLLHMNYSGAARIACDASYLKGAEMGWFEHGSTIIVFAPAGFTLAESAASGARIRMGEPLFRKSPGNEPLALRAAT